jgi:hypothetical protein
LINGDAPAIINFTRRHGDLHSVLGPNQPISTAGWIASALGLAQVARAWTELPGNDVSELSVNPDDLDAAFAALRTTLLPAAQRETELVLDPTGAPRLVMRARTLRAFMVLSASAAFRHGTPMRRCLHCRDFFEAHRRDMRFCSASCRSSHAKHKET